MSNYDFRQLSPHDFEQLARDLIQARDGIILESFKNGRDLGIDFRHANASGDIIVQCKHYVGTGLPGLIGDLKKEAVKVEKLKPTRYILVTSVGLTPLNKVEIQSHFGSVLAAANILGPDDINNLLGLHPEVERRHYKLWLASRVVLDRVIHNASITQSEFDVERVYRDIRRYVRSAAYPRALDMLNSGRVAIISGAPGVGKTSLAKMLLYVYLEQGYEAVSILTDFQTGRERYQPGKRQIFYFDDFIGATFLGERASTFTRNEDRAILDFIEMVRASPTARLVMTTREHILSQAIATSEKLKQSRLIDGRCVLEIGDYSHQQRAEILYNHIYFSDLPDTYREALLSRRFYKEIVNHQKFNPRLVDWLSSYQRLKSIKPDEYQTFVRNLLANPAEIWRYAYENQISDAARSVLLALYTFSGRCSPYLLEFTFRALHTLRAQRYGFKTDPADWRRSLSELSGSFIRPGTLIEVIDPSVLDMLNSVLRQDTPNTLDMIEAAIRFEQARRVWTFARTPGNHAILHYLSGEEARFTTAVTRLLDAPRKIPMEGGTAYVDDSPELRLGTVLDIAETLKFVALRSIASEAVDQLVRSWETEQIDITEGLALLVKIEACKFVFSTRADELRKQILDVLALEASGGCRSDELRELLGVIEPADTTDELTELLQIAARVYQGRYFSEELRECKSESDFDGLEEDLATIAERTFVNLEGPLHAIHEKKAAFEDYQNSQADQQYDEWKDRRHELRAGERALDDMFDSLRKPR
jgi:Restriction endonuclease